MAGTTPETLRNWAKAPQNPLKYRRNLGYELEYFGKFMRNVQIFKEGRAGRLEWLPDMAANGFVHQTDVSYHLPGSEPDKIENQKVRYDRLRADALEIKIRKEAGELIEVETVNLAMTSMITRVKTQLMTWARTVSDHIHELTLEEKKLHIEKSIRSILSELSVNYGKELDVFEEDEDVI